ncbi:MAG: type II CRISPR RNA-guided endonuclease Cas9 [Planctomycetes bacterium]|nr:type II CRISPR RNA-guided endonuclease Cas9 [Planctomycetota bacterium]
MLRLGLDVGSSSLGWALVDEADGAGRIVASGVRIFPEGVDRDTQGGEQSKSQSRREARGARRQSARRRRRKAKLVKRLVEARLLPGDAQERDALMLANPYELRAAALSRKLEPFEIGRALIHLAQRRGFLSNRKTDNAKEEKGMLAQISSLAEKIESAGCSTLGEYLYGLDLRFSHTNQRQDPTDKEFKAGALVPTVRRLHTRRSMYVDEFLAIWDKQHTHHPDLLTDELKRDLYRPEPDKKWVCKGLIFGQRRMYWPKSVVGQCELEPKLKRCVSGERCAQRFRILVEVNNIKIIDRSTGEERTLSGDERATLIDYLSIGEKRTFDQIRKKLGFHEQVSFNLEGPERKFLKGHITDTRLTKAVGKKPWAALDERVRDAIARVALHEDQEEEALPMLLALGLKPEQAQQVLAVRGLPETRMAYSIEAIERLLPHLERGLFLMGNDASDSALHAAGYLRPDEQAVRQRLFLPPAPDLPNPIVRQAMVEVRRVVNAILRELCDTPTERGGLGGRRPDAIHIELAREAKRSFEQRQQMRFDNAKRKTVREEAADTILVHGGKPTPGMIRKYQIWEQQGRECVYSGKPISLSQLLSDATDTDHILPRWQSLDDSMMNKVVCFREFNANKGDRTPRQWLEGTPEWDAVLARAEKLPYPKLRRFLTEKVELDDFVNRQFTDTAYISRAVSQYMRCLGVKIVTPRGGMTAELRRRWGLNSILSDEGAKNREDHRHHAVDAAVIAMTTHKRLHALANERGENVTPPWKSVRQDLAESVLAINVSHRVQRRLRGALHEDTLYGRTQKNPEAGDSAPPRRHARGWTEADGVCVRRKPIAAITTLKHIAKVRDKGIRLVLKRHLETLGVDTTKKTGALPKKCFEGEHIPTMPSGVPIKRVRMLEKGETWRQVRPGQLVKPGSNHHIVYREKGTGDKTKWVAEVVTMWDAAIRVRKGREKTMVDRRDTDAGRFVMSLSMGEMFMMDGDDGERVLCTVRKMDQVNGRLHYKAHTDARPAGDLTPLNLYLSPDAMRKCNAKKVTVDPIGRIRWAND